MEWLGFWIFISTIMYIDYKWYIRGSEKTWFFKDETDIEKDLREIQKLEIKQRLKELREKDSNGN
jgi:hypothetical protein